MGKTLLFVCLSQKGHLGLIYWNALQYPIKCSIYYFPPAPTFQGQMRGGKETAGGGEHVVIYLITAFLVPLL